MLNARPDSVQREAAIIAQAGLPRRSPYGDPALTISTSMAGRGTDIRLGGDPQGLMRLGLRTLLLPCMIKGASHPVAQLACSAACVKSVPSPQRALIMVRCSASDYELLGVSGLQLKAIA